MHRAKDDAVYRDNEYDGHLGEKLGGCHILVHIEKKESRPRKNYDEKPNPYELPRFDKQTKLRGRNNAVSRRRKKQPVPEKRPADSDGNSEKMQERQKK